MFFSDAPLSQDRHAYVYAAVVLLEQGVSCREISRQLNVNVRTIYGIRKWQEETGSVADKQRSGRPTKMTVRQDRALVRLSLSDRRLTSPQLRQKVETDLGVTVCASTIRKRLNTAGLRGWVAVKKPLPRQANVKARLNFACTQRNWGGYLEARS